MVTSGLCITYSLVRLRRNAWKSRPAGGGNTDLTNLVIGIILLGFGISMLLGWS
jgi:hypothetical protein